MSSSRRPAAPSRREAVEPDPRPEPAEPETPTIAGLSGFGRRPSLHPSWREPDQEPLPDPGQGAAVIRRS